MHLLFTKERNVPSRSITSRSCTEFIHHQCVCDSDDDWDDYMDHIQSLIDKQNAKTMKASRD